MFFTRIENILKVELSKRRGFEEAEKGLIGYRQKVSAGHTGLGSGVVLNS